VVKILIFVQMLFIFSTPVLIVHLWQRKIAFFLQYVLLSFQLKKAALSLQLKGIFLASVKRVSAPEGCFFQPGSDI
jgi:hypothetical protein